jgi:MoxR-like ATPase
MARREKISSEKMGQGMEGAAAILQNVVNNVKKVIVGKDRQIRDVLSCWIAGGHVLIEDVPGTGKTILARAIAKSTQTKFQRVQFTPDLLPSDIIGSSMFRQDTNTFEFHEGPIFTAVLLGDEINRATPRTQSALLEAMSEGQVSIDGQTRFLDSLFFTIATQNPVDQLGTFPLPEAQLDRFMMKISMGYPGPEEEIQMIRNQNQSHPIHSLGPVESHERLMWVRERVKEMSLSDEVYGYISSLITKTRQEPEVRVGASPRAAIALARAAQASALFDQQDYVTPGHVFNLIKPVLSHRLILTPEAKLAGRTANDVLDVIISKTPAPIRKK